MANQFEFNAQVRTQLGKGPNHRLRAEDKVPAVVYGGDGQPQAIFLEQKDVLKALKNEAVFSHILTLKVGNQSERVVLKDLQRHHFKPKVLHMDFLRIKANEKLTMHVPLHFINEAECPGVKAGGVIAHLRNDVTIKCLPDNLPEFIEVDVAKLELDHSLHLSDLKLPKGVEFAHELDEDNDQAIVNVHIPRVVEEETPVVEAAAEGEEGATAEGEATDAADADTKEESND